MGVALWHADPLPSPPEEAVPFETQPCPNCRFLLTFHQPDPQSPERLLATCAACQAWFVAGEGGALRPVEFEDAGPRELGFDENEP
jgi:hypothetical protein